MLSRTSAALALVTLVALAPACNRFRKAKDCERLASTVSAWLSRQPPPKTASAEPKELALESRATAQRYRELDRELAALDIKSVDLVHRVQRYREIASQSARALDDAASALDRGDAELARRRRVEFDAIARSEAPLVGEINAQCRR